jgi:hypothetical protein
VPSGKVLLGIPFYGHQFTSDEIDAQYLRVRATPASRSSIRTYPLAESSEYRTLWGKRR